MTKAVLSSADSYQCELVQVDCEPRVVTPFVQVLLSRQRKVFIAVGCLPAGSIPGQDQLTSWPHQTF